MTSRIRRPSLVLVLLAAAALPPACGSDSKPASSPATPAAQTGHDSGQPSAGELAANVAQPAAKPAPAVPAPKPAPGAVPAPAKPAAPKAGPSRAAADAMSEMQLAQRRDLWPARVAFLKQARLDATTGWKAGEELPLNNWTGPNVVLDQGTFLFEWAAGETDVVQRTRDNAAALSPEALALTVDQLRSRPELWPTRLTLTASLQLAGNTVIPAGREVALRFFDGPQLSVYDRDIANYYTVEANETDVMARARVRLALPAAERAPFFVRSLEATLDPAFGTTSLADADYLIVYSGRLGCPRCAAFAPKVKEFYARARAAAPAGAHFELVFLSNDPDAASAKKYLDAAGLPGGAIAFDRRLEAANLMTLPLVTLPGFFVFDRAGNVLDRNDPNAGQPTADDVLAKFEARVKAGAPAGTPH